MSALAIPSTPGVAGVDAWVTEAMLGGDSNYKHNTQLQPLHVAQAACIVCMMAACNKVQHAESGAVQQAQQDFALRSYSLFMTSV